MVFQLLFSMSCKIEVIIIFSYLKLLAKILTNTYIICIISVMRIRWDPQKAEANFRKHRIRFSDAETVLFDPMTLTIENQIIDQEQRFLSVGSDAVGRILVIVYTYHGDTIRLISARKATSKERKYYEKGI